jgi:hypothetical protein
VAEDAEKGKSEQQRRWIPAFAGMTATTTATALDSGPSLRWNDSKYNDDCAGFQPSLE